MARNDPARAIGCPDDPAKVILFDKDKRLPPFKSCQAILSDGG
jgi:hypothetical protein